MTTAPEVNRTRSTSSIRLLLRLRPYVAPAKLPLIVSGVFALLSMLCGLTIPLVLRRTLDGPIANRNLAELPWLLAAVITLGLIEPCALLLRRRLVARPVAEVEARMRADLYQQLQRLPVAFHDRWQSGQLLSRAVTDLSQLRRFLAFVLIFLLVNSSTLIIGYVVLLTLDPLLGVPVIVAGAPMLAISYLFETRYKSLSRRAQDQQGDLATIVEESVLGIRVLKSFGRGREMSNRFLATARELRHTELRKVHVLALLIGALTALPEIGIGLQPSIGGWQISDGTITVGNLVAAVTVATFLRWPMDSIGWLLAETNQAASACQRFFEVRDGTRDIGDAEHITAVPLPVRGALTHEKCAILLQGQGNPARPES